MSIGRLARTFEHLHPLQVVARPANAILGGLVRDVPSWAAPCARGAWSRAPEALRALAEAERERGCARIAQLPAGSRLRAYEEAYGLDLGGNGAGGRESWGSRVAVEPFPASVRARRIAVATRLGARGLEPELARAARAVLLRPEVHLLGNHLLENGFALACAGSAAAGAEADAWWRAGRAVLRWQIGAQFLADGGHVERSASYHVALLAALLETIEIAEASGRDAPREWRDAASRALGWATAVRTSDGSYPLFNDAAIDAAPSIDAVLSLAGALGVPPAPIARVERAGDVAIAQFEATGWVRIDVPRATIVVDAAPDAGGWQPGHAHADGLTFEAWIEGTRAIVDYGVASYADDDARRATRATRSHNTVEIEGCDSCEVWGAFRVGRRGRGRVVAAGVCDGAARLHLDHDGYAWMPGAPRHARSIDARAGRIEVRDRVEGGRGGEEWASRLRLDEAAAARVRVSGDEVVRVSTSVWHARHGQPRPAVVFEQRGRAGEARDVAWRIEW